MHPKLAKWLDDIAKGCEFICEETAGYSLADYERDDLLRNAIERNAEIIGHALMRLQQTDLATATRMSDYQKIIDLSDHLVHNYGEPHNEQVWDAMLHLLPALRTEAKELLQEADDLTHAQPTGDLNNHPLIDHHLEAIRSLCREFGVARLEVFGSVMTTASTRIAPTLISSSNTRGTTNSVSG